ncbi:MULTISPECIES: sensor histidine kinase [unclassified Roseofilum]|uniref:sensor histidine kinase n=1 Tax=unclassified Roseofilum TaxID=2620099 RepID=UPI001B26DD21|nr:MULTISPECIES: ATP-binding protein [unclassified Roseofilum]MBP0007023.1 HAMP domain-containing protein [Roseofilum sp. Belize Diploria]MBP0035572.1 HAMP domain-containing protein [Roseofilum sp. Belize BBD 4]
MLKRLKIWTALLPRKLSLRVVLVVPFVLQVSLAVSLTGWLSLRNGQKAISQVTTQLHQEITARIEQELANYIHDLYLVNQINQDAVNLNLLSLQDYQQLQTYFGKQLQAFESISAIKFSSEQGEFLGLERSPDGYVLSLANPDTEQTLETYQLNGDREQGQLLSSTPDYDSRLEVWYENAIQARKATWGGIYTHLGSETLATSVNQPVYTEIGKLLGVFGAEFRLSEVSDFLRTLDISPGAEAFILERSGLLVASSTLDRPFLVTYGTTLRIQATNTSDRLIQSSAQYLQEEFDTLKNVATTENLAFLLEGERQFLQVTPFQNAQGIDWIIVVVVPEADFMEQINANTWITIQLCAIALFVSILLGLRTSHWISQSLHQLIQATGAIAKGNLNQHLPHFYLHELETLRRSFNEMSQQLRHSFQALETANQTLEERVEKRTEALKLAKEKTEQALQELKQTQSQLIQTEKMSSLGQIVAGVAHEINNPISFIYSNLPHAKEYLEGLIELIELYQKQHPKSTNEIHQKIQQIDLDFIVEDFQNLMISMQSGADRIQKIVLGLRSFSRLDESDQKWVNIQDGLENSLMILQANLQSIQVIESYTRVSNVFCYPGEINQVFFQILENAIDALSEPNIINPTLWIETQDLSEDRVQIRIADNGPGISESVISSIFDPFFTTKPVGQGTGLGLSISYQIIVEKHKGELLCNSTPGKGAEFLIRLPIKLGYIN